MWSHGLIRARPPVAGAATAEARRVIRPTKPADAQVHPTLIGRAAEAAAVLDAVRRAGSAVVVGASGVGKTALLQHVQRSLADTHLIHVRGVRSATEFPFRALAFLLSEVPPGSFHPALVFSTVRSYLHEQAGGRRIVLVIDNAEHLDRSSSTLIGQLVAGGVASVILTVTDFARADATFRAMWRDASLRRVDLGPVSFEDTQVFVETELGESVSRECVEALYALAGGNLQATRAALRSYVHHGAMARRGSAWVLLPGVPGISQEVVRNSPLLQALPPGQRTVVDLLALVGSIEWSELVSLTDPADVDALQDAGVVTIDRGPGLRAALATPGLSAAVAEAVPPAEASELWDRLERSPAVSRRLAADPARMLSWSLRAGRPVGEPLGVAAASVLNDDGAHARAGELIAAVGGAAPSHRLTYQALIAASSQGHGKAAARHAVALAEAEGLLDPAAWTLYKIEESRLRRTRPDVDAAEPLTEAADRIAILQGDARAGGDGDSLAELARLERLVLAARGELASFEGRYLDNLQLLPGLVVHTVPSDHEECEFQIVIQSLLLEALAMVDQQSPTDELTRSLARNLAQPGVRFRVADAAVLRVEIASLLSADQSPGGPSAAIGGSSTGWSFRQGSLAQLADGLTLIGLDRTHEAVRALTPVVEQSRVTDPHGILPLAAAALMYCHSLAGPIEHVIAHLPLSEPGRGSSWIVGRAARHYQLLSSARMGSRGEAGRRLHERASKDLLRGASSWALVSLAAAVRLGRQEAVAELGDLACRLPGPLARACTLYARALVESDVNALLEAMNHAAATGDRRLVADMGQSGINATTRTQDRAGLRAIQRRLRELLPETSQVQGSGADLALLTAREREVAALAAGGSSNRAIAQEMFVSVRTVEGHLYQVYSKLSVSSRAELAELVPTANGL